MDGQKNKAATRIFIVGHNTPHREEVRKLLGSLFSVSIFDENDAAFDAMLAEKPDLVFLDDKMAENGMGCLFDKRSHSYLKDIPFIISGPPGCERLAVGKGSKIDTFLIRPFTKNRILALISDTLSRSLEKRWAALPEETKTTLQSSLDEFQSLSKAIEDKKPLDLQTSSESCKPLAKSVSNQNYQNILDNVRGHHNYTYVHSLRVATYLSVFGHAIGIRDDELLTLATGGLLHDVGKLVTPQDVLNKSSKLDEDEWQCMKQHVLNSSEVYDQTPDITHGIRVIGEQHHEKLDGSGYPHGLKGSQLNELARMSAIVDIFGALTDERSYKPAFPPEMAFGILEEMSNQLDQRLVGIFREVLEGHGTLDPTKPH